MQKKNLFMCVLCASLLAFSSCGSSDSSSSKKSPVLTLQLTDAPGDLEHAWIEISRIVLQGSSDEAGGGGVVLLDEPTGLIDLLTLASSTADLVRDLDVPAGTYTQLRLIVSAAIVETEDGQVFATDGAQHPEGAAVTGDLTCPSCEQTGIKVKLPGGALRLDDESRILVLDFDVSESFGRQAGRSGRWVMRPVIHSADVEASGTISGSIALADGVVIPECGGQVRDLSAFVPQATDGAGAVRSGAADAADGYQIRFVAPGSYIMGFAASVEYAEETLSFSAEASVASAAVESGRVATVDYTVTAASCQ